MSNSLLFGAGAIVTLITLWGVLMVSGLFFTRHEGLDDDAVAPGSVGGGTISHPAGPAATPASPAAAVARQG